MYIEKISSFLGDKRAGNFYIENPFLIYLQNCEK